MKCENCLYKETPLVSKDIAFDTEYKQVWKEKVDICTLDDINIPCDDAYLTCPYREITVEAQHIQHAINLLRTCSLWPEDRMANEILTIDHLNKILKGEDLE